MKILTARELKDCHECGREIQPGEKFKHEMSRSTWFQATCMDCVEAEKSAADPPAGER